MKKALIFGVTGQDGSYLTELLLSKGYFVIGVTRRSSTDNTERIKHIGNPNLCLIEGDITDPFFVSRVLEQYKPDEVYNLAAQSHVGSSFNQPSLTWDITAGGTLNVLEAIRHSTRKENIRFYQASSSEMFGKNYSIDSDTGLKYQDENTAFMPQSPYAIAKLASHHLVRNYRDSYNIFACSGILFNHESPRRGENFVTRKITKWVAEFNTWFYSNNVQYEKITFCDDHIYSFQFSSNRFPKLRLGNIDARRDWGHAKDYVRGMWMMMQQDTPDDYVLSTEETHSVKEFLRKAIGPYWGDLIVIDPLFFRPAEVEYLLGSCKKAREKLGWVPEYSFDMLVKEMVQNDMAKERQRTGR